VSELLDWPCDFDRCQREECIRECRILTSAWICVDAVPEPPARPLRMQALAEYDRVRPVHDG